MPTPPPPLPPSPPAPPEAAAIRDLMGLLALPALWAGQSSENVLCMMVDAVCAIAPVHVTLARVTLLPGHEPAALFKAGDGSFAPRVPDSWRPFMQACDAMGPTPQHTAVLDSPVGRLTVLQLPMDTGRQQAQLWFGSLEAGFPSAHQAAFLGAAVSLAASGLNQARSEYERDQAHRAKDEFLAMLGHELRNPLAPIVTTLGLIRIKGSGPLAREHEVIERQVGHLSRLVDDLLDITRITRDKVALRREVFSIRSMVTEAVEAVSPLLEERQHRVTVELAGDGHVDADPARMRQVLSNLLINAAKYTPPGGHVRVLASTLAGAQGGRDMVEVRVEDNGTGIDPLLLPRVFDLFEQGPMDLDRARGGLGIGLAIVKKLMALHGGSATVHSDGVGKGACFTLRLPLVPSADAPQPGPGAATEAAAQAGRRVLLVDDNVDALESLEIILTMSGFEVMTAHDPAEALRKAPAFAADAYVLDIGLPGLDGYQLATELRRLGGSHAASARFVALTGYGQASDRRRAAEAGFHQHLVKPVDIEDLLAALQAGG